MFFRSSSGKLVYPFIVVALLVIVSYRPKYRLRADMPTEFFSTANLTDGHDQTPEEKIARAYWESAQMNVQWRYPYQHPLPTEPPPEFKIDAQVLGPAASDPATRALYWLRLQNIWYLPDAWTKEYEWDWGWASDPITNAGEWLHDRVGKWFTLPN
jgi:hypothetical protein